jgi:hypothetical protein
MEFTGKVFNSEDEITIDSDDIIKIEKLSYPEDWTPPDADLLSDEQLEERVANARAMDGKVRVWYRLQSSDPRDLTEEAARGEFA